MHNLAVALDPLLSHYCIRLNCRPVAALISHMMMRCIRLVASVDAVAGGAILLPHLVDQVHLVMVLAEIIAYGLSDCWPSFVICSDKQVTLNVDLTILKRLLVRIRILGLSSYLVQLLGTCIGL